MLHKLSMILFMFSGLECAYLSAAPADPPGRLPDEFESDGGHTLGFSYGGTSAVSGLGSVKNNPAMLVFEKKYQISAGYNWPSVGREFYQAGVIDSQTSPVAAGFTYTSFRERFKNPNDLPVGPEKFQAFYDSPIKNRLSIALAQPFTKFSAGIGAQIVNSAENQGAKIGVTMGAGVAGLLTPALRFGLSLENLGNRAVKDLAPTTYRAGLAYLLFDGDWTVHLDYRQRQRVSSELVSYTEPQGTSQKFSSFEKMAVLSSSVRVQDLLRLLGGYAREIAGRRSSLSGGVALVNRNFSLSYLLGNPYLGDSYLHQALNLEFQVAF